MTGGNTLTGLCRSYAKKDAAQHNVWHLFHMITKSLIFLSYSNRRSYLSLKHFLRTLKPVPS